MLLKCGNTVFTTKFHVAIYPYSVIMNIQNKKLYYLIFEIF